MRRLPSVAALCAVAVVRFAATALSAEPAVFPAELGSAPAPRVLLVDPLRPDAWHDLQRALDAAQVGDIVLVRGGVHGPIRIEKGLHLLADPTARIRLPSTSSGGARAAIEIRAGARAAVTLAGLVVDPLADGGADPEVAPAIRAEGCGRVALIECRLEGGSHAPGLPVGPAADGAPALEARGVAEIWLSRTHLRGGAGGVHASSPRGARSGNGGAGVHAPDALVLSLRSTSRGGDGGTLQVFGGPLARGGAGTGGVGGCGVEARLLIDVGSMLKGGDGAPAFVGRRRALLGVDGPPVKGCRVAVPDQLEAFGRDQDAGAVSIVAQQAAGEQSFLACADRLDVDEELAEDEGLPFLDLRAALRIDVAPAAELPVAPGLLEVLFELEGRSLAPIAGIPMLVQQVRQTPSGETRWSNPEIVLRWPRGH